jgi:hypothetical protein
MPTVTVNLFSDTLLLISFFFLLCFSVTSFLTAEAKSISLLTGKEIRKISSVALTNANKSDEHFFSGDIGMKNEMNDGYFNYLPTNHQKFLLYWDLALGSSWAENSKTKSIQLEKIQDQSIKRLVPQSCVIK